MNIKLYQNFRSRCPAKRGGWANPRKKTCKIKQCIDPKKSISCPPRSFKNCPMSDTIDWLLQGCPSDEILDKIL